MKRESKAVRNKTKSKHCRVLFVNFAKSFVCVSWRSHLEMVALSMDRHMVLRHLKIVLIANGADDGEI